jgi:tRNA (guanine26-N2/guanine27-N2)-dimethyltransferase
MAQMEFSKRFGFPVEVVKEGNASIVVPRLEAYVTEPWEYAPSKAPVFYNPLMELNRDIAVLALQVYQQIQGKKLSVCEPLTGCGIRGVRFAAEVEGVQKVILNDINPKAAKLAQFNAEFNKLTKRALVLNEDANLLLSRYAAPRRRFHFIDVDPFGPPAPYLDAAIRALSNGGLLALTATDMAPLCGVHPNACIRKYGGRPLRTEYCHELAIRLLIGCLVMMAAKHEIGIEVMFSHSTDHYIRVYATAHYGARKADHSVQKMGYILHCFSCFHRETSEGLVPHLKEECPECGSTLKAAGPLWISNLSDSEFCSLLEKEMSKRQLKHKRKISKLLFLIRNESEAPHTYYVVDKVSDKLNLPVPSTMRVLRRLRERGFEATLTHFNSRGIKTNAPSKVVKETIEELTKQPQKKKTTRI